MTVTREDVERRVRQLCETLASEPSPHDDPEYRARYLKALFARTSGHEETQP